MQDKVSVTIEVLQGGLPPRFATADSACADLYAASSVVAYSPHGGAGQVSAVAKPGETLLVGTGVRMAIPRGYEGIVRGRSGLATHGIHVHFGTIDADYRGEVMVLLENRSGSDYEVMLHRRIAQIA